MLEKLEDHWKRVKEHQKEVDSITELFIRAEKTRASATDLQSWIMSAMRIMW